MTKVEFINPFITSLANAFQTMLCCEVRRGGLSLGSTAGPRYEISGIIGLSGRAVGTVVVSFSRNVALKAASAMLLTEATQINADVIDAVGELANMVAGGAKAELEEYQLSISLPSVVTGAGHAIRFPSNVTPVRVPFDTDWGAVSLEVGLVPTPQPALAAI